jgi:hypothetical protein
MSLELTSGAVPDFIDQLKSGFDEEGEWSVFSGEHAPDGFVLTFALQGDSPHLNEVFDELFIYVEGLAAASRPAVA